MPVDAPAPGDAIELALRPEKIAIATSPEGATMANVVESRIKRLTYFGAMLEITADAGDIGELTVQIAAWRREQAFNVDQTVWLHWPDDAAVIVTRPKNQE